MITKDTKEGETFIGKPSKVSWERLWTFSGGAFSSAGWPRKNIHTDLEFAKNCGLPSVAASATQFMGYVAQLMIDLFGVEWLSHGTMDVKFINIVDAGDILITKAEVQSKGSRGGSTQFTMAVSCENQKSAKVLAGSATGVVGKAEFFRNQSQVPCTETIEKREIKGRPSLEPLEFVVTPEFNQQYLFAEEDFHPWYIDKTEIGPPIAHPALLLNMSNGTKSPSYRLGVGEAGFHARDETFFLNPARVGKKIRVTWKWLDAYEKRGRPYYVSEALVVDEEGLKIIRRFLHSTIASKEYKK